MFPDLKKGSLVGSWMVVLLIEPLKFLQTVSLSEKVLL